MSVSSICTYNVATIRPKESVKDAAVRMREEHVGDLIVIEQRNGITVPVGILTDRDLVLGVLAKGVPLDAVTVGDVMTRGLLTVKEDNGISFTLREMRRVGVRRAPVVDNAGGLVGVVSIDDAIEHISAQLGDIADAMRFGQRTESKARP